jgi:indole-3-glycerol phosphate synthase
VRTVSFLERACVDARCRVASGYYGQRSGTSQKRADSLLRALRSEVSLIAEVKPRSPSAGQLRTDDDVASLVRQMVAGGAEAVSVLTDPDHFGGSTEYLTVASSTGVPTLMKDFVVSKEQIEFAASAGASAVLLVLKAYKLGLAEIDLKGAIRLAHDLGLEVLLEVYRREDLKDALAQDVEMVGINSRDLEDLSLNLERARAILSEVPEGERWRVVIESGIKSHDDVKPFLPLGANKFLVGTALMTSGDVAAAIRRIKGG